LDKRIETFIAACFYYSGLVKMARWWTRRSGQRLLVLNYHRATGGDLRAHLLYVRQHYRVLHLETALAELYTAHQSATQRGDRRTVLALTFDDGYYDNFTQAFTLARDLHVPLTIFLIPGYMENSRRFWWMEMEQLVESAKMREATVEGHTYHFHTPHARKSLAQAIDSHIRYSASVMQREASLASMRQMLAGSATTTTAEDLASPLTWEEVHIMEKSGWISFGAHTMHHPVLAYLTDPAEMQDEISQCRRVLQQHLGHPVRVFAYPFGLWEHIGEKAKRAVRDAGYDWGVSAIDGFNTRQTDPYLMRRIEVDVDQHWLTVAAKASGIWGFFSRPFRLLFTHMRSVAKRRK
jgi:peptidoglycan/xylan/chitin deacetylase (PgdA/CDA1 family)